VRFNKILAKRKGVWVGELGGGGEGGGGEELAETENKKKRGQNEKHLFQDRKLY